MADKELTGDRLTLGIRRNEWVGGQDRIFKAFMEHEKIPHAIMEHGFRFKYMGVPVYLYIYDNNPCLDALDIVFYNNDTFIFRIRLKSFVNSMTTKTFRKKLIKIIEDSEEFVTYDNNDKDFKFFQESEFSIVGKDDTENFIITIEKI